MHPFICPSAIATLTALLAACGSGVAVQGGSSAAALAVASTSAAGSAAQATPVTASTSPTQSSPAQVCAVPLDAGAGAALECPHCAP